MIGRVFWNGQATTGKPFCDFVQVQWFKAVFPLLRYLGVEATSYQQAKVAHREIHCPKFHVEGSLLQQADQLSSRSVRNPIRP
jgi:hypothetical protein